MQKDRKSMKEYRAVKYSPKKKIIIIMVIISDK